MRLLDIKGGLADNAICRETAIQILVADPFALEMAVKEFDGFTTKHLDKFINGRIWC